MLIYIDINQDAIEQQQFYTYMFRTSDVHIKVSQKRFELHMFTQMFKYIEQSHFE